MDLDISVVTPNFNMLNYLPRCCASVADQEEVSREHIVTDDGSSDGSVAWLSEHPSVVSILQANSGMYNAVNRGFRQARGAVVSHLNADEQYLPGALAFATMYLDQHPEVDVLFGDALLVRPDGSFIAFRKGFPPIEPLILSGSLYLFTGTMFIRRHVLDAGELYDESYCVVGDVEFIVRLLRKGYTLRHVRRFLSVFTMTGANLATYTDFSHESGRIDRLTPVWIYRLRRPLRLAARVVKLASGAYFHDGPIVYSIYTPQDTARRRTFLVDKPTFRWRMS